MKKDTRKRISTWRNTSLALSILLLASSLCAAPPENSGTSEASQELVTFTLTQAVEIALRLNPEVLSAREKAEEFNQLVREAKGQALPEVDLTLSLFKNRDPGLVNSPFFARLLEGPDAPPEDQLGAFFFTNYVWNFGVSQPLFTFGRIKNARRAAAQEREGVDLDILEVENRIARDVVRACYAFLLANQNLNVLTTEQEARERQLERVELRFDLEDATRLDLLRARVALANLRPEVLQAENNVAVALASVNNTLSRPVDAPIQVLADLEIGDEPPSVLRPEALLELAGQYRPELRRYSIDRDVLESRMGVTSSQLKPEVRANASFGINTFAQENVANLGLHTWNVGVSLDWKLFDGNKTPAQVGALRSQVTSKEHDEHAFRNRLSVELKDAGGTWIRAVEAFQVATLAVSEAKEAERVAEDSLTYGAATTLDVLQATLALRESELNQTTAAHDALVALAEMKYLVGFRADAPDKVIEAPRGVARVGGDSEKNDAGVEVESEGESR